MPVTRRCVLHVGAPKTGTTYLQDIIWGSEKVLRTQGFRLPLRSITDHFFLTLALRGRLDPSVDPPDALDVLDRFQRCIRKPGTAHLLISHELLAPVEQGRIDEFIDLMHDFEVHVVITARDLARQVPAEWQQRVKTRAQLPYGRFVNRLVSDRLESFWRFQDVASMAQRWGRSLPPEHVHIVTVPPSGSSPEVLLERFCAAAELDPEGLCVDRARLNQSVGYEQTELLRRVNAVLGERLPHPRSGYSGVVKFWFTEMMLAQQEPRQRLGLPPQHWDWCVSAAKEMVVRLEEAGYAVHGDLADLIPSGEAPDGPHRPSDADVAAAAVEVIAAMLEERHRHEEALAARGGVARRALAATSTLVGRIRA